MIRLIILFLILSSQIYGFNNILNKKQKIETPKLCFDQECLNVSIYKTAKERQNIYQQKKDIKNKKSILESHKTKKKIIAWTKYFTKRMDIIWLDENFVIIESLENAPIFTNKLIIPTKKSSHILKMPKDTIKNKQLSIGQQASLYIPNDHKKISQQNNLLALFSF